jgi:hypothetical protein
MAERVACKGCGQWMFHLAVTCPHCGAPQQALVAKAPAPAPLPTPRPVPLTLSPGEAQALLAATSGAVARPASLIDVAREVVLPQEGLAELALSLLAAPVTVLTVLVLGYLLLRERRSRREERLQGARLLAVPACTALAAVSLLGSGLPGLAWAALGASFGAWLARELSRRARAKRG